MPKPCAVGRVFKAVAGRVTYGRSRSERNRSDGDGMSPSAWQGADTLETRTKVLLNFVTFAFVKFVKFSIHEDLREWVRERKARSCFSRMFRSMNSPFIRLS